MTDTSPSTRWVTPVALALVAVQLATRAWVGVVGYFNLDDYVFYTRAAELPLWNADLLLSDYNGHLMPGSMVWVWLTTDLAPLDFAAVISVSLLLQLVIDLLMLVLLRRLFGNRPAILVPFTLFVATTITLPAMVWWAAALNQLPQQLFMLLAFLAHLRYLRSERTIDAALCTAMIVAGLAFSEKSALTMPLLFMFTWLFVVGGPLVAGLVQTVRRYARLWLMHVVVGVAYVIYYVTQVDSPARGGATLQEAVELVDISVRRTVVPGLLGGPWTWKPLGVVDSLADPPVIAQVVAFVVVAAVVAYSIWLSRGAYRAWALLATGIAVEALLLLFTRVQVVGVEAVAAEYRYFTDLGIVAALALGLAFLPIVSRFARGTPTILTPATHAADRQRAVASVVHVPSIASIAVIGLVLSSLYSAGAYRDRWSENPGRDYFAAAQADLGARDVPVDLYDGPVPTVVVWRLLWPATLPSRLLLPTGVEFEPFDVGRTTPQLYDLGADGHLRESQVQGIPLLAGPDDCGGWDLGGDPVRVPLESEAFDWNWVVRLDYTAAAPTQIDVTAGRTQLQVPLDPARTSTFLSVSGALSDIVVNGPDSEGVCVTGGTVGLPQPVEW